MLYLPSSAPLFLTWLVLVVLFTPHIPYHIEADVDATAIISSTCSSPRCQTTMTPATGSRSSPTATAFYPAMLEAIRGARETVNLECYIFRRVRSATSSSRRCGAGAGGRRRHARARRHRQLGTFRGSRGPLREAGCRVERYQRITWYRLGRLNNRTHRELLVVDGRVAFVGGAGVADWWAQAAARQADVARHDGALRRAGRLRHPGHLGGELARVLRRDPDRPRDLQAAPRRRQQRGFVDQELAGRPRHGLARAVPDADRGRERATCWITTPYFLPDKAFRKAFVRTAARGVEITVIVPGPHTDQRWVRLASRRMYGQLLEAGVRIYEYQPGMTHVKALLVDDLWAVVGTTNFDNRSFEHNDEVNVAFVTRRWRRACARLRGRYRQQRRGQTRAVDAAVRCGKRSLATVAWILERQQ